MAPISLFIFLCIFFAAVTSPVSSTAAIAVTAPTVYEILQSYNFPVGLLPTGATGYNFDAESGEFSVHFDGACSFSIQGSHQLRYEPTISGRVSQSRLQDLKGISVKVLLFWVNIIEVERSGDNLEFSVGIMSADFPIDNFDECPQCGCGMDCGDGKGNIEDESMVRLRSLLSVLR